MRDTKEITGIQIVPFSSDRNDMGAMIKQDPYEGVQQTYWHSLLNSGPGR
jgi:hypothetical protein